MLEVAPGVYVHGTREAISILQARLAPPVPAALDALRDVISALREARPWLSPVSAQGMNYRDGWLAGKLETVAALLAAGPRTSWVGWSPRRLMEAGIAVDRRDFWVRDADTNVCRLMTDAEWDAEMSAPDAARRTRTRTTNGEWTTPGRPDAAGGSAAAASGDEGSGHTDGGEGDRHQRRDAEPNRTGARDGRSDPDRGAELVDGPVAEAAAVAPVPPEASDA
jgi:hypothetical protein